MEAPTFEESVYKLLLEYELAVSNVPNDLPMAQYNMARQIVRANYAEMINEVAERELL